MGRFVSGEVVGNRDVAGLKNWRDLHLDTGFKRRPVHRAIQNLECRPSINPQARTECLGGRMPTGCIGFQTRPAQDPPPQTRNLWW